MKRFCITTATLMIIPFSSVLSQPVLTNSNTPQPNSTYIFQSVAWDDAPIMADGADLEWDYSSAVVDDDTIATPYTSDPSFNSFPEWCFYDEPSSSDSSLLRTNEYIYHVSDTSMILAFAKLRNHHSGGQDCVGHLSLTKLKFPFSLMDTIHQDWAYGDGMGSIDVRATANGSLILPDTTYPNCLLVHTMFHDYANFDTYGGHIHSMSYTDDHYEWYTEDSEVPVLGVYKGIAIDVYYMGPYFTYFTSAYILQKKNIGTLIESNAIIHPPYVFPNPTSGRIEIRAGIEFDRITISDITGCKIKSVPNSSNHINLADLSAGTYFIQFISATAVLTQKLIKL